MIQKMIVTGGAGFIGSHLVDALVLRGDEVHVIDNYANGTYEERRNPRAVYHDLDVRATDEVQKIMEGADVVFHMAALPRVPYSIEFPIETTETNIVGTASVLTASARAKVRRVVYSASGSAYGAQDVMPLQEDMLANPVNPYGLQKYVGELFAKVWTTTYGIETVCLRYFNVYGSRLDPHGPYALAVGAFLLARKENRPLTIFGDGTITRDYTHVRDVVRANILAAENGAVGKGEVINIGAGRNITIKALAEMIGGEITYAAPRIEAHDSRADNTRARELIGWIPEVTLEVGIAELKKEFGIT